MKLNQIQKKYIENKLSKLSKSKFRTSFHLNNKLIIYIEKNGFDKIESHANDFIRKKIAIKEPINDGKQTPMKNHPVFIAQHACACCCRSCLEKWHNIPKGRELNEKEISYLIALVMEWIKKEYKQRRNDYENRN